MQPQKLQVGRLGKFSFPGGDYVYAGSALGPGGLKARISRHLRGDGHHHWHVDWLREAAEVIGCWYQNTRTRLECHWSQVLAREPGARIIVPGFGASDCRLKSGKCSTHLFLFEAEISIEQIGERLTANQPLAQDPVEYVRFISDSQLNGNDLE
jgi:Uri superfamily endonuclease